MTILVLGATGLLGNAVFRVLSESEDNIVFGTTRNEDLKKLFIPSLRDNLIPINDLQDEEILRSLFEKTRPSIVINCTSLDKSLFQDHMKMLSIFSVFPRRLACLCKKYNARLVHISTDGVFSGKRGNYTEEDFTDAEDLYGITKFLGEINKPGALTLRTSIIGHSILSKSGLLDWFLSQKSECVGYSKVLFSGLPTVTLAKIIRDIIIPSKNLWGTYHLASERISKLELLKLVAQRYDKEITIVPDDTLVVDRSLSAAKFTRETGYTSAGWTTLIDDMFSYKFGLEEA